MVIFLRCVGSEAEGAPFFLLQRLCFLLRLFASVQLDQIPGPNGLVAIEMAPGWRQACGLGRIPYPLEQMVLLKHPRDLLLQANGLDRTHAELMLMLMSSKSTFVRTAMVPQMMSLRETNFYVLAIWIEQLHAWHSTVGPVFPKLGHQTRRGFSKTPEVSRAALRGSATRKKQEILPPFLDLGSQ